MKTIFVIIIFLHGLIHFMGFFILMTTATSSGLPHSGTWVVAQMPNSRSGWSK
ncbi:MAG: hypothetical protein R6U62_06300 [Bacteroidales bacterium]